MTNVDETLDVIAVGAHPDDCEIGCGGTLAALAAAGLRVGIIDLTDGEPTPRCDDPAIRVAEAQAAARELGIAKRIILDLPNRRLFDSFEARVALASEFRLYRPKLVLGLRGKTPMASPDHWQASQITDAAIFYSRLSKWDEHFDGLEVHTIQRHVQYDLLFAGDYSGFGPLQFVHDISATLDKKMSAIKCYKTQFPPGKTSVFDRVEAMAKMWGLSAGIAAGEMLTSVRPIVCRDLFEMLMIE